MPYERIAISSGHSMKCQGAVGILNEVDEARKVVEAVADELILRGVDVRTFHDNVSTSQDANLHAIVAFHNSCDRDLDVSVHFNAFETNSKPMGVEVLYVTQEDLADELSRDMAEALDLPDRGGKYRDDLYFLNNTDEPAILIEVCFVDSSVDADHYRRAFSVLCSVIADRLGGTATEEVPVNPTPVPPEPGVTPRVDIKVTGEVLIFVNGEQVGTKG
jgi:N-acetylmuramoyl-L-alanine amidase